MLNAIPIDDPIEFGAAFRRFVVMQVPDVDISEDEVEALVAEADAYSLASHLFWAMWALLQSKVRTERCSSSACARAKGNRTHLPFSCPQSTAQRWCWLDAMTNLFSRHHRCCLSRVTYKQRRMYRWVRFLPQSHLVSRLA